MFWSNLGDKEIKQTIMKARHTNKYMRLLSVESRKIIRRIVDSNQDRESRWIAIKSFFLKRDPSKVDNLFAWNLYLATLKGRSTR